jgi:hypothetical protein
MTGPRLFCGDEGFAVDNQPDIEGRSTHVGGDHPRVAVRCGNCRRSAEPTGGPRIDQDQRIALRDRGGDDTTIALHGQQRAVQAVVGKSLRESVDVCCRGGTDQSVDDCGGGPLVFPGAGRYLVR